MVTIVRSLAGDRRVKGWLSLNALTELSDAAAESLSRSEAHLDLNGLSKVSRAKLEKYRDARA